MIEIFLAAVGGLAASIVLIPACQRLAFAIELVDRPAGDLKTHAKVTPYLGGVAFFLAGWGVFFLMLRIAGRWPIELTWIWIFVLNCSLLILGTVDDKFSLPWNFRLIAQIGISAISIHVTGIAFLEQDPILFMVLTILLTGLINSANLIDISDGLAGGCALIAFAFLLILTITVPSATQVSLSLLIAAYIGALGGFLRFNWNPAKIFMGDGGSNAIGHLIGILTLIVFQNTDLITQFVGTVLIFGVGVFDTLFVIAHRLIKRSNPFKGSPDHFAVRMRRNGIPINLIALRAYIAAAICGVLSAASLSVASSHVTVVIALFAIVLAIVLAHQITVRYPLLR